MIQFFIRSKTNDGDFAKQYFTFIKGSESVDSALAIRKLVYTSDSKLYSDFKLLRSFKGKNLVELRFSIKLATLNLAIEFFNKQNKL